MKSRLFAWAPSEPTDYFSSEDWRDLHTTLSPIATELLGVVELHKYGVVKDSRWPKFSVQRRKLWRVRRADLQLQSQYLSNHEVYWELVLQQYVHVWPLLYRLESVQVPMLFTELEPADEIVNTVSKEICGYLDGL